MYVEKRNRTILKSVTWRITATLTTTTLVFVFTGRLDLAFEIGLLEVFIKMVIFYFHERLWGKLKFGMIEKKPFVILITGLSGSGKTELSNEIYAALQQKKIKAELLQGRVIRKILPEIGFSISDRKHHLNRLFDFTKILVGNHTNVIISIEAPFEDSRQKFRDEFTKFVEIFVNTSYSCCENRDEKNLYQKAKLGEIDHFVGVQIPFEEPKSADFTFDFERQNPKSMALEIIAGLKNRKYLS